MKIFIRNSLSHPLGKRQTLIKVKQQTFLKTSYSIFLWKIFYFLHLFSICFWPLLKQNTGVDIPWVRFNVAIPMLLWLNYFPVTLLKDPSASMKRTQVVSSFAAGDKGYSSISLLATIPGLSRARFGTRIPTLWADQFMGIFISEPLPFQRPV